MSNKVTVSKKDVEIVVKMTLKEAAIVVSRLAGTTGNHGYELYDELSSVVSAEIGSDEFEALLDDEDQTDTAVIVETAGLA